MVKESSPLKIRNKVSNVFNITSEDIASAIRQAKETTGIKIRK